MSPLSLAVSLTALLILLILSGYFSSAETAFTMANRIRIQSLADEGDKRAVRVLSILEKKTKMLSTILIGNNIVNISASSLSTYIAIRVFGNAWVGLFTGILTILILIFGEIMPKSAAVMKADDIALRNSAVIGFLMVLFTPVIAVVERISFFILKLRGIDPDAHTAMTENELRTLVDESEKDGVIETDERLMIHNVVDLMDTLAREIMIPRIDMTSVPVTASFDELIEMFRAHRFTRLPVYEDTPDNVIGILNMKDLLVTGRENFVLTEVMREPYFTYETKNISDLLDEMRLHSLSIVIVLDEYGATSGLLTLEDVLEEIVGDIHDEYRGRDEEEITEIRANEEYSLLGSTTLADVNEALGTDLSSEEYDTIGGYIIEHSEDSLPKVGEFVMLEDGSKLIVEAVRKNRIMRVHYFSHPE